MSISVDVTEVLIFTSVRAFLLGLLTTGVEVVRGQSNRVPPPKGTDYLVLTPLGPKQRLSTNVETWDHNDVAPSTRNVLLPSQLTLQCDVFGPSSLDNASVIEALWFSTYGCDTLATSSAGAIQPLFVEAPKQAPFIDAEQQWEERWVVDLTMQVNQNITLSQDFLSSLAIQLIEIDTRYPPGYKLGALDFSDKDQSGLLPAL